MPVGDIQTEKQRSEKPLLSIKGDSKTMYWIFKDLSGKLPPKHQLRLQMEDN